MAARELVPLILLAVLWLAYFAVHSLLADRAVRTALSLYWPRLGARYRLAYNGLALVLLVPPLIVLRGEVWTPLWAWPGVWGWLADGAALLAAAAFVFGPRLYDLRAFVGLRPAAEPGTDSGQNPVSTVEALRLSSWHRHVRHPWYALALVVVWTRPFDSGWLLSAVLITAYFIVGSRLEEAKLIAAYGDAYRRYRARVPGLVPLPGRRLTAAEAVALEQEAAAWRECHV